MINQPCKTKNKCNKFPRQKKGKNTIKEKKKKNDDIAAKRQNPIPYDLKKCRRVIKHLDPPTSLEVSQTNKKKKKKDLEKKKVSVI